MTGLAIAPTDFGTRQHGCYLHSGFVFCIIHTASTCMLIFCMSFICSFSVDALYRNHRLVIFWLILTPLFGCSFYYYNQQLMWLPAGHIASTVLLWSMFWVQLCRFNFGRKSYYFDGMRKVLHFTKWCSDIFQVYLTSMQKAILNVFRILCTKNY